jgi:polysaccharide pyruvyl transferase WcaK-like protein
MENQMKIGLLGQFGSGNSGNDGSLESMLSYLGEARPDARLLCICSNPAVIEARYNVPSVGIRRTPGGSSLSNSLNKMFANVPRRVWALYAVLTHLHRVDVMIIPGTGILDDFQETAFGWPFILYWWCLAARIRRAEIAFVSIGAGPIKGGLSRWFLKSAAEMAKYRSYRDDYSLQYMKGLGVDVSADYRYPDIAFSLPAPSADSMEANRSNLSVGVGIMHYRGWERNHPNGQQIYETYVGKISAFISWLVQKGYRVRLFTGDVADKQASDDIMDRLATIVPEDDMSRIDLGSGNSLHEVMDEIAKVDVTVVSRYHNLVCALKLGRPTISLGYALKNDNLMAEFGQEALCHHIETFDVDVLTTQVHSIISDIESLKTQISTVNEVLQSKLGEQRELLQSRVLRKRH